MLNANTYVTEDKGIGGTIRNRWEDFYVEEIPEMLPDGEGPNIWIWIEKLGRSTLDVLLDISRDLHISRKRTGFAGMKDKNAITRQWICISNMESEEQFKEVEALAGAIKNTEFLEITRGRKKLRMGQLKGNKFRILIKDVEGMENFDINVPKKSLKNLKKPEFQITLAGRDLESLELQLIWLARLWLEMILAKLLGAILDIQVLKKEKTPRRLDKLMMMVIWKNHWN